MKSTLFLLAAAAGFAQAKPNGMSHMMRDLARRQAPPNQTVEMIGDLLTVGAVTPVGKQVKTCLEDASGNTCVNNDNKTYTPPGKLGSPECAKDTCCVWDFLSVELVKLFTEQDGTCNALARAAVRLGFHDAAAWSKSTGPGGADGSLLLNSDEIARSENNGLQDVRTQGLELLQKYKKYGVGAADLVQFMHNLAVVICPLGPRQLSFVGRADNALIPPQGLIPKTTAAVTDLLQLFLDKTIGTIDLISLIGAHTTATQRFVNPAGPGPLDSTVGVWDVAFYSEVLAPAPAPGTFRLPSDDAFSKDNRTERGFVVFSNVTSGQVTWNAFYSKAYLRLSLLGVNNINKLTDCTKVLPNQQPVFVVKKPISSSSSSSSVKPTATSYTTSTIYSTKTLTSTKDGVKHTTTSVYPISTTICPISETPVKAVPTSSTSYTTSTIMATKTHTFTDKGITKYSMSEYPISTTVCPVTIIPVSVTASSSPVVAAVVTIKTGSSSPVAAAVVSIKTGMPYSTPAAAITPYATGTGAYVSPAQFTGAAGRNGAGFAAAFVGAAAVALL